jgi:ribosomal protein S18 acetylase RimI-like enzyme
MAVEIALERPDTPDATALILELEAILAPRYPAASRHGFSPARLLAEGVDFYVLRADGAAAACGGVLIVDDDASAAYAEVKRMFVRPAFRGSGFGKAILDRLAARAGEHGVDVLRLETGIHQVAAIGLYERTGFRQIAAFGPYVDDPLSRYFEKRLA